MELFALSTYSISMPRACLISSTWTDMPYNSSGSDDVVAEKALPPGSLLLSLGVVLIKGSGMKNW